jgi:hypothetical protein
MKNFITVIALVLGLAACNPDNGTVISPVVAPSVPTVIVTPAPVPVITPAPVPTLGPSPSPTPAAVPFIKLGSISGATASELTMIQAGDVLVNQVIATPCFKAKVLAATYTENLGLTQPQIWAKLINGPVVVNAVMYTGSWYANHISKTIGYENDPGTVYMNRYFVNTSYMVADNLSHEGEGHSKGFSHYYVKATSEPYGMNTAFEACAPAQ